jgi:hypothetical protein
MTAADMRALQRSIVSPPAASSARTHAGVVLALKPLYMQVCSLVQRPRRAFSTLSSAKVVAVVQQCKQTLLIDPGVHAVKLLRVTRGCSAGRQERGQGRGQACRARAVSQKVPARQAVRVPQQHRARRRKRRRARAFTAHVPTSLRSVIKSTSQNSARYLHTGIILASYPPLPLH